MTTNLQDPAMLSGHPVPVSADLQVTPSPAAPAQAFGVIEKNVPIPSRRGGHGTSYPYELLEIGDSFLRSGTRSAAGAAAAYWGRKLKRKFTVAKIGGGPVRVWRTK